MPFWAPSPHGWKPGTRALGTRGKSARFVGANTPSLTSHHGYINFDALFRPYENVCGFAETFIESERERALSLWIGGGGALKVYWNGAEVLQDSSYRLPHPDRQVAVVGAHRGFNRLLVKTCVADGSWGFFLRVGDARGAPLELNADASSYRDTQAGHADVRLPALQADLDILEQAAARDAASAQALEDLARYLSFTESDDPAERRAKQLAARAATLAPTVSRLRLAAALANERGDVMRFGQMAADRFGRDPEAKLVRAHVIAGGPSPEDALPILTAIPPRGLVGVQAAVLRARILRGLGLNETARTLIEGIARRFPSCPGWILERVQAAQAAGREDEVIRLRRELLARRHDHVPSRRALALDALRRGEQDLVLEQLTALDQVLPDDTRNMMFMGPSLRRTRG